MNWDKVYESGREFSPISEIVLDNIFNTIQNKNIKTILDVGCGKGQLIEQLQARGYDVSGIDLSKYSADIVGDFMSAELGEYNMIIANKVVAFNDTDNFVKKVKKHLTEDGVFVCMTPVLHGKYNSMYTERLKSISVPIKELETILKSSFSSIQVVDTRRFDDYGEELTFVCTN